MKVGLLKNISNKFVFAIVSIVLSLTAVFITYFTIHNRNSLEGFQKSVGVSLVQSMAESSRLGLISSDPIYLEQPFSIAMNNPDVEFIAAYDKNGSLVSKTSRSEADLALTGAVIAQIESAKGPFAGERTAVAGDEVDDFFSPVFSEYEFDTETEELLVLKKEYAPETIGRRIGAIRIGMSRKRIDAAEGAAFLVSAAMGITAAIFAIAISLLIASRITKPLKALEQGTKNVIMGNLDVSVPITSDDELGSVAGAFNKMTAALRETTVSKDFMDGIVESMNEAMVVLDNDRSITTFNSAAEKMLGFNVDELKGLPVDSIFYDPENHPVDGGRWQAIMANLLSNAQTEFRTKEGHRVPVTISTAPMKDKEGAAHGVVLVARDMSEVYSLLDQLKVHTAELENYQSVLFSMLEDNERARAETESERAKTVAAVESMADGLVIFDLSGKVLIMNRASRAMLGFEEDTEATAEGIRAVIGDAFDPLISNAESLAAEHFACELTLGAERKRAIRIEGLPVTKGGERIGSILVMRDVTKQRELDQAKYELISNVSHELRTPLAIISNVISNALIGVSGELDERLRTNLEMCGSNTRRLTNIIDKLLNMASMDKGDISIKREMTDLSAILKDIDASFEQEARIKGISMSLNIPKAPIAAFIDAKAIGNVLLNLLSNAIRFTEKGSVTVEAGVKGSFVEISVSDTGIGIPKDEQSLIFDSFHQIGRTYGPGEKGVGLGLAISRKLIEQHGGSISVMSAPGKGTRFTILLPIGE